MAEVKIPKLEDKDFPGNTGKEIRRSEKIIEGGATKRKKTLGEKISKTFLSADFGEVIDNCVSEVVVPAIKNLLYDTLLGGLEMTLFGEYNPRGSKRSGPYIDYTGRSGKSRRREETRKISYARKNIDDVFFDSRTDAYNVLDNLCAAIEKYGEVSVADLNDLIGEPGEYTDNKYGWDSLSKAEIKRYHEGYLLVLPSVISLDD